MIGKSLGHYRITEKLGEGGMGVVYKARDTHLDRFVALKTLPGERVADAERKRRFVQEAKAASALNHPNIVTIYDIDQAEGTDFIAMEYVSGKTLDDLIPRKGMRLSLALKYAVQISDALARAHSAGIIHRDLKPSNVMVDEHGQVKVLDFGLAKLTETEGPEAETATERTEKGTILGTAAYMSPEQAEGKQVDVRSDIFSFGSLLYEMLSGQRAFKGDTKVSTIAAILKEEPKQISEVTEDLPREVERVVKRCLRKDPAHRFQHMEDLKVALEELKEESDSGKLLTSEVARRRRWLPIAVACILVSLLASVFLLWQTASKPSVAPRVLPLTSFAGYENYPSLSPDGKQVAFSWNGEKQDNQDIYVKLVGSEEVLRLTTDTAPDIAPTWSPDGSQIAFVRLLSDRATIFLISPIGGTERKIANYLPNKLVGDIITSITWCADGTGLVVAEADAAEGNGLFLIPMQGGEKRSLITAPVATLRFLGCAFGPVGRSLAYVGCTGERTCEVFVQDFDHSFHPNGASRQLTSQGAVISGIAWSPDGQSVIYTATSSMALPTQLWRVMIAGGKAPELQSWAGESIRSPAVSRIANKLAFVRSVKGTSGIWKIGSPPAKLTSFTSSEFDPQFSSDGKRLAFCANRAGKGMELWVAKHDGTNPVRLKAETGRSIGGPRWSPNGRWIVYNAQQEDGRWDVFRLDAESGQTLNLTSHPADENLPTYSRDGKWIYFCSNRTGRYEIWRMPAEGGTARQVTEGGGFEALESWDGKILYYTKGWYSGLFERPVAGGPEKPVLESIALPVGSFYVFENGIYYVPRPGGGRNWEIRFLDFPSRESRMLFRFEADLGQGLTVSPDQKVILYTIMTNDGSDLMLVENFR